MATATARIPVLVTEAEKARIVKRAKEAGVSTAEYMRRAAKSFYPSESDGMLEAMIGQMLEATERAEQAIEETLDFVAASNRRIAEMESRREAG